MVVFGKTGCIREIGCIRVKVVVLGQKWFNSGKSRCIRSKVVVIGKWVVFGQGVCIRAKWLYSGKSVCSRAKVVVFGK